MKIAVFCIWGIMTVLHIMKSIHLLFKNTVYAKRRLHFMQDIHDANDNFLTSQDFKLQVVNCIETEFTIPAKIINS